jgi:hypothetical protein
MGYSDRLLAEPVAELVMIRFGGRPFQLHLSTCVVLMFVAGWFLGYNVVAEHRGLKGEPYCWEIYGWPWRAQVTEYRGYDMTTVTEVKWEIPGLLGDVALVLGALFGVTMVLEGMALYRGRGSTCTQTIAIGPRTGNVWRVRRRRRILIAGLGELGI